MVMVITVDGTGDPGTGLGRIVPLIDGMPAQGLLSLVDFDGGTNGQANPGPYLDKSGLGNNLTLKPGYTAPIQRATGLEVVSPHGAPLGSLISGAMRDFTVVIAATPLMPGSESGVLTNFFSANQSSFDDGNPANSNATPTNYPVLNITGSSAAGSWALYASTSAIAWGSPDRRVLTGAPGLGAPALMAISVSGTEQVSGVAGIIRTMAYGQAEQVISSAAIASFFDGVTSRPNLAFGVWPNGSARSAAPILARLHATAVYDRSMTGTQMSDILTRMRTRLATRGVEI